MKRDLAVITLHYLVGVLWTNELDDLGISYDQDLDKLVTYFEEKYDQADQMI